MEDLLSYRRIQGDRYIYISSLSRRAVTDSGADHLGDDGYFLYECGPSGIDVLAKAASFEAALRLLDILDEGLKRAVLHGERQHARALRRSAFCSAAAE